MAVFEHLSEAQGQTLSELAEGLGQSPATLYRVLTTLHRRGLVEFDPARQVWSIGAQAFIIGSRYLHRTSLADRARPILRELMEATGETANLGVAQGQFVLFVSQAETQATIRAFFPPGTLSPLHASGIGKALLAQMDEPRLVRFLAGGARERFTSRTLCDDANLISDLEQTRARGYALDAEERTPGMRCIAAPVFDMHGEAVAGLSVSGPTGRMGEDDTGRIGVAVIAAANQLTAAIGGAARDQSAR